MSHESLLNELWQTALAQLGGTVAIEASARETRAFVRPRAVRCAADLLRLILAYCLGGMGLRSTSAWAASAGLADLSNVALLQRLRKGGSWMEHLVGKLLGAGAVAAAAGRRLRLLDGTAVPKAGKEARENNGLWRLHCAFDLPAERFSFIELTDEKGGERLDRTPVAKGDILVADRGYMHPDPLAHVLEQGADIVVRAGWKSARWLDGNGKPFAMPAALAAAGSAGILDRPIWIARKKAPPLPVRLVAFRKPPEAAERSRAKARRAAKRKRKDYAVTGGTLAAAEWVILVTSLKAEAFPAVEIGELYRARWRIEMAFKRLKSIVGLSGPPGEDQAVAKTWILAHLLMILLLEPQISAPEISPRMAA
jgi:Transposase DDE domain